MSNKQDREEIVEQACEIMHDAYEAAALAEGWETQARSNKPWADVPEANKATMRTAVRALLASPIIDAYDEQTLTKVYEGLADAGVIGQQAKNAVFQMQNRGILFRERSQS